MKWRIELLGGLRVEQGERAITRFRTRKAGVLLAYLAFYRQMPHSREILTEILWPEQNPEETRHKLRQALSTLRRQLEPPGALPGTLFMTDRAAVQLNPAAFTTDVAEFEAALAAAGNAGSAIERAQRLTEAVQRYRGELLPGYFEEWVLAERQRLAEQFQRAMSQLIRYREQSGDLEGALEEARRAVAADPLREEAQHELIRLLATAGQREAALRQYRELERLLQAQLGEAPAAATRQLVHPPETQPAGDAPGARSRSRAEAREENGTRDSAGAAGAVAFSRSSAPSPLTTAPGAAPTGTVTFLLTDIEGSTALWERTGHAFRAALASHHTLLREAFRRCGGYEVKEAGDSFVVAFSGAADAAACAIDSQRALAGHRWPEGVGSLKVRMALHTGDVEREKGDYRGLVLHHAARMVVAAHGGQLVCSEVTAGLLRHAVPGSIEANLRILDLGLYRLRDVAVPERLFQVEGTAVTGRRFPPLNIPLAHQGYLPLPLTRFFDRDAEIAGLLEILTPEDEESTHGAGARRREGGKRLVTLTGPGGSGKTRLAVEAARRLADHFAHTVYFVPLAALREPALIADALREALQLPVAPPVEPLEQVVEALASGPALLVLDNFEHLREEGAPLVRALLERLPRLTCLITSRQRLGLSGEQLFPVPPLPVPACRRSGVQAFRQCDREWIVSPRNA